MMKLEYEKACREAGLKEERIRDIRRVFDADKKRLMRSKEKKRKNGGFYISIEAHIEKCESDIMLDLAADYDLEREVLHSCDIERLQTILAELSPEDRSFILDYFENSDRGRLVYLAKKYKLKPYQARDLKNRLFKMLKKRFFEEI